jgi:CRP-like cAMP-binding protein
MYIQKGSVTISVLSRTGTEAVVAMLGPGDFFGEGALTGQPVRIGTATATAPTSVLIIDKGVMLGFLRDEPAFAVAASHVLLIALTGWDFAHPGHT